MRCLCHSSIACANTDLDKMALGIAHLTTADAQVAGISNQLVSLGGIIEDSVSSRTITQIAADVETLASALEAGVVAAQNNASDASRNVSGLLRGFIAEDMAYHAAQAAELASRNAAVRANR